MPHSKAKSVEQRRRERAAYMRRKRRAETPEEAEARRAADRAARAERRRAETPEAARQHRLAMKKRMKRRRAKEKERAAEAEKRPAGAAVEDSITSAPVRPQARERSARRRPLLDGGPEGVRAVEPPPPPLGGDLLRLSLSLKRDADAIGACAAQALGFHAAAVAADVPERLTAIIQRVAAMLRHLGALEQVQREAAALHADLQSIKAQLAAAADRQVASAPL